MRYFLIGFEKRAKESSYLRDFMGGVDPTGVTTFNAAKQNALEDAKAHGAHRGIATIGGVIGGSAVVAPAISGTMGAITGAMSTPGGWKRRALAAGKGFISGAKQPFQDIYHGFKGSAKLRAGDIAKSSPHMEYFAKKLSPEAKGLVGGNLHAMSPVSRQRVSEEMTRKAVGGLGALGLSGGISGGSAYLQYGGGRDVGEELRQVRK